MNADPGSLCLPLHIMSPVITGYRVTSPATDASQAQARAPDLPSESPCDAIPCRKVSRGLAGACTRFRLAGVHWPVPVDQESDNAVVTATTHDRRRSSPADSESDAPPCPWSTLDTVGMSPAPRQRERPEVHLAMPTRRCLETHRRLHRLSWTHAPHVVPYPSVACPRIPPPSLRRTAAAPTASGTLPAAPQ